MLKIKVLFLWLFVVLCINFCFAQETLTITTYYPSPYGSYNELETRTLYFGEEQGGLVAFKYPDTTYDRRLRITAGRSDTQDNDQGASIDLHGNNHADAGRLDLVAGRNNDITFWSSPAGTGALQRMTLDENGNVGIGTSNPDGLQVNVGVAETARNADNARLGIAGGTPRLILEDSGATQWEIDNLTGRFRVFNPGVERFTITSTGNVGIGTTNPVHNLQVEGSAYITDRITIGANPNYIPPPIIRLLVTGGGTVLNGYVDITEGNSLVIRDDTGVRFGMIRRTSGSPGNLHIDSAAPGSDSGGNTYINWFSGKEVNIGNGAQDWGTIRAATYAPPTSRIFKKDIQPLTSEEYNAMLSKLEKLEVVRYRYKDAPEGSKLRLGVIAEDSPEEILADDRKSMSLSDAVGFLLATAKAQQQEIRVLEAEIGKLNHRVEISGN